MNSQRKVLISLFCILYFVSISNLVFAQECLCPEKPCPGGLVPCGRRCDDPNTKICECWPCTFCHIFVLIKRIFEFLLTAIAFPVLIITLMLSGFFYLTSGGNPKILQKAKTTLTTGVIGFAIAFGSWIIVNTVITILIGGSKGLLSTPKTGVPIFDQVIGVLDSLVGRPWYEVTCPIPKIEEEKMLKPKK